MLSIILSILTLLAWLLCGIMLQLRRDNNMTEEAKDIIVEQWTLEWLFRRRND